MPIAYLDVPEGIEIEKKKELVKGIYEALREAYPFPPDHRIFVREWPLDSVSQDGQLGIGVPETRLSDPRPNGTACWGETQDDEERQRGSRQGV